MWSFVFPLARLNAQTGILLLVFSKFVPIYIIACFFSLQKKKKKMRVQMQLILADTMPFPSLTEVLIIVLYRLGLLRGLRTLDFVLPSMCLKIFFNAW